jgi:hypothetical protein
MYLCHCPVLACCQSNVTVEMKWDEDALMSNGKFVFVWTYLGCSYLRLRRSQSGFCRVPQACSGKLGYDPCRKASAEPNLHHTPRLSEIIRAAGTTTLKRGGSEKEIGLFCRLALSGKCLELVGLQQHQSNTQHRHNKPPDTHHSRATRITQ